jgi:hypothetical protein
MDHHLAEAVKKLHRAGDQLVHAAHQTMLVAQHYHTCARRVDHSGKLDAESSEALAEAVRLLNGSD